MREKGRGRGSGMGLFLSVATGRNSAAKLKIGQLNVHFVYVQGILFFSYG